MDKYSKGANRYRTSSDEDGDPMAKLSVDISNGKESLSDFFEIECSRLKEFSLKNQFDFSEWSTDKFEALKASIKDVGVLHPIIVRYSEDKQYPYEILAGEHRWKATKEIGLLTIPAKIVYPCDDEKAKTIFTLTNILSRDITIMDKILGWGHYYKITKWRREESIQELKDEGILPEDINVENYSKKQIRRYYYTSTLAPELLSFVSEGILGVTTASFIATMPEESKKLILKHRNKISTKRDFKKIIDLYNNKIKNYQFDDEGFQYIFSNESVESVDHEATTFTAAAAVSKKSLKKVLKNDDFHRADQVTESAFGFFYQLEENPKIRAQLTAHVSDGKDIDENDISEFNMETVSKILESSVVITALEEYFERNSHQ